jgi:DNA-binding winged helix-turn-helix (wHTH) protein/tetratricopeptide (TPR) repeat protein
MAAPQTLRSIRRYRFANVELDTVNVRLRVDGNPCACSRKAFDLLLLLCQASGRTLSREELIDSLWPGGQVISDEALTQVIFRARAVLGSSAEHVRTIRGVGLRLDAQVLSFEDDGQAHAAPAPTIRSGAEEPRPTLADPANEALGSAGQPTPPAPPQPILTSRRWTAVTLVALALTVAGWLVLDWPPFTAETPTFLDDGYGLTQADLRASHPDTGLLLREALQSEARGERARGVAVLEALHQTDATSPVPATFLALWAAGSGKRIEAIEWLAQARNRAAGVRDVYLDLLIAYVDAEISGAPQQIIDSAGALLDVRPGTWRMRHARAHLMEYGGMRQAALRELQLVEIPALGHRKRDLVIADRASMGDIAGAQSALDRLDPAQDPVMHAFLAGRIAWSRGDFSAAHSHFMTVAAQAFDHARLDLHGSALIYAGAIEVMQGRDTEALATLDAARKVVAGRNLVNEVDVSLFMAQLHAEAGRHDEASHELDRALATAPQTEGDHVRIASLFVAWRLHPERPPPLSPHLSPAAHALWRAFEARAASQPDAARTALLDALQQGIDSERLADEARWMALQLHLPVESQRVIDPPYPPLSRVVLRRQLRAALAGGTASTGPGPSNSP